MRSLPQTKDEMVSALKNVKVEHVTDLGSEKRYGVSISGMVRLNGNRVSVIGSVELDEDTGEPIRSENTSFHAFPDGITEQPEQLLSGEGAIEVAQELYEEEDLFIPRSEADISFLAT